jgi:hypothetical protein
VNSERRGTALLGFAGLIVAVACGDPYLHTNPYDPAALVAMDISGPDTLFSLGEIGQFSAQTNPVFPDSAIGWALDSVAEITGGGLAGSTVNGGTYLSTGLNSGAFQSLNPPLEPVTVLVTIDAFVGAVDTTYAFAIPGTDPVQVTTVRTKAYRHYTTKTVAVTQRVAHIQLRCPDVHACDTVSAVGTWSVWVDGFDALGHGIVSLKDPAANPITGAPLVTYAVRDTTIARSSPVGIRATTVTAIKSGTTWVVATRGALADSLQLVVR